MCEGRQEDNQDYKEALPQRRNICSIHIIIY